jgi:multiple sugar transport system substrate-binding protein
MELRPVTPSFSDVVEGLFTGQLSDVQQAMQDLQDRSNAELDRAIQAAVDEGAQVSRDDWVFPNWDPRQDYGLEKYEEL